MHRLLKRQITRFLSQDVKPDTAMISFLEAIDDYYHQIDKDHLLLQNALTISNTELNAVNQRLQVQNKEIMHTLLNTLTDGVYATDLNGKVIFMNETAGKLLEQPEKHFIGQLFHKKVSFTLTDGFPLPFEYYPHFRAIHNKTSIESHGLFCNANHQSFPIEYRANPIIQMGKISGAMVSFKDNRLSIEAENKLREANKRKQKMLVELEFHQKAMNEHAIVSISDRSGKILYVNQKFIEVSQYSPSELKEHGYKVLNSAHHPMEFFKKLWETIIQGNVWHDEIKNRKQNGQFYWVDTTIVPFMNEQGIPERFICISTDISESKLAAEQIQHLAFFDPLTNLPNRRLLMDKLDRLLITTEQPHKNNALLFIDLDNFKTLNDTLGHSVGDLLLQQVSLRLKSCVREKDTVARLGGDEFIVMLTNLNEQQSEAIKQVEAVATKILTLLNKPYSLATHEYNNSTSIGIILFNNESPLNRDLLLQHADIALYQSKKAGRNTMRFFNPQMQLEINARVTVETDLHLALDNNEFQLYYQSQVDNNYHLIGMEALIRWIHPKRGIVLPEKFIPLTKNTDLIISIGLWTIEKACSQLKTWQESPDTQHLTLSVNISAEQFTKENFVTHLLEIIQRYGIKPDRLKLELTENIFLEKIDDIILIMNALRAIGIGFLLDKFGTGYSSLEYLKNLPLDQLKIAESFIHDLDTDKNDQALVRTIISIAHNLNLDVIAEGVETEEQRQFLIDNGCRLFQGHLFSKPLPIEQIKL